MTICILEDFNETGFVFALSEATKILIPKSESVKWEAELSVEEKHFRSFKLGDNDSSPFEMLVQKRN
jgi:hypothetical protein